MGFSSRNLDGTRAFNRDVFREAIEAMYYMNKFVEVFLRRHFFDGFKNLLTRQRFKIVGMSKLAINAEYGCRAGIKVDIARLEFD